MYEHAATVRRFLNGRLAHPAAVDDATQETFARALTRRDSLREDEKLVPWLLGIARLVSFEHRRRAAKWVPSIEADEQICDERESPEAELIGREAATAIGSALQTLGDRRRQALLLRVEDELGYEEIARSMGWSTSKVKNELHRARTQLRSLLAATLCALGFGLWGAWPSPQPAASRATTGYVFASMDGVWCVDRTAEMIANAENAYAACLDATPAVSPARPPICE